MSEAFEIKPGRGRVDEAGRIVIPAEFRKALGIRPGDGMSIILEDDGIKLMTMDQVLRSIQKTLHLPVDRSLADELIQERREEAARE